MSLFKTLTELAVATTYCVRKSADFRKDAAISVATLPIYATKKAVDALDSVTNTTNRTKNVIDHVLTTQSLNPYNTSKTDAEAVIV